MRNTLRLRHYSLRTEEFYLHRIQEFIYFHGKLSPVTLAAHEVLFYLSHLAVEQNVAASTQNVARSALILLYRDVLDIPLEPFAGIAPAKQSERLPVVFTRTEVTALLETLIGTPHLMASLLYGADSVK